MERELDKRTSPVSKTGGTTECEGQDLRAPQNWRDFMRILREEWNRKN